MTDLERLVTQAKAGQIAAFEVLVRRFQDMAVGYCLSILGDFEQAQDAAQEAFLTAYYQLPHLRETVAFSSWFRRILFKHCDRLRRRRHPLSVSIGVLAGHIAAAPDPALAVERRDIQRRIQETIAGLPPAEREVVTLFYLGHYSQRELASFLDLPLSTVKSRLYTARKRLKERMLTMIEDHLPGQRPSQDDRFVERVTQLLQAAAGGEAETVQQLVTADPSLIEATVPVHDRLWIGQMSALHWAVIHQQYAVIDGLLAQGADINAPLHGMTPLQNAIDLYFLPDFDYDEQMIDFLLNRGAEMDIFSALWLDKTDLVKEMIRLNPQLVHARGPGQCTPLCFSGPDLAAFLIDHGADILAPIEPDPERAANLNQGRNPIQVLARWPAIETVRLLLERANIPLDAFLACVLDEPDRVMAAVRADPTLLHRVTANSHVLGGGLMLLHLAARYNRLDLARFLLAQGADVAAQAPGFRNLMPLHIAAWQDHPEMAQLLIEHGANAKAEAGPDRLTPLAVAQQAHGDGIVRTAVVDLLQ